MIRRPPRSTQSRSSAASDVYKRQVFGLVMSIVPLLIGVIFFGSSVAYIWALALGIILGNACLSNLGTLVSTVGSETPQNVMLLLNLVRLPMMFISGIFIPINQLPTLSLIHISEPTRLGMISYAVFCLK